MNGSKLLAAAAAAAITLGFAGGASAATVVSGAYTLSDTSFGTGFGVHSDGSQTGTTIGAHVNIDGSAVTFTSPSTLTDTGGGEAQVQGLFTDLTVDFAKSWNKITFAFSLPTGPDAPDTSDMTIAVNGSSVFSGCAICTLTNGENKFTIEGPGIHELQFGFDPAIADGKQFRVDEVSTGVPEPATWGMMLSGFFGAGALIRRTRRRPAVALA